MPLESQRDEDSVGLGLESPKEELPVDVILRMLGEYSARVSSGLQLPIKVRKTADSLNFSDRAFRIVVVLVSLASYALISALLIIYVENIFDNSSSASSLGIGIGVAGFVLALSSLAIALWGTKKIDGMKRGPALELAVWQLRRVYQVASRMEDFGRDVDFARRLEFELRLSEAQFLLNRAEKLGITEETADAEIAGVIRARSKRSGDEEPSAASSERPSQTPSVMKMAEIP